MAAGLRLVRSLRVLVGFLRAVRHPERLDEVVNLAAQIEEPRLTDPVLARLRGNPTTARALAATPRLGPVDLDRLLALPAGTLGHEFAKHMRANELDPNALPTLPGGSDLDFVRAHLYETHDLWHVLTGFDTDVAGEMGLQAFYLAQVRISLAPVLLAVGLLNTVFYAMDQCQRRLDAVCRGWSVGQRAMPLFGTAWAERWDQPLASIRAELGLGPGGS
jgi:ubiquinone biosynthesis protein Coq4